MKFLRFSVLAIFLLFSVTTIAQIGINTVTPDSSASLHILSKPSGSGLIIPELTEAQRLAIAKPAVGLMVFDVTAKLFYVNMESATGNYWYAINPWLTQGSASAPNVMYTSPIITNVGVNVQPPQVPQATLDVNGDTHTKSLSVDGFSTNALVPTGAIVMWSGDPLSLPAGWALCDGSTIGSFVTPDLRGRFIVGFDKNASNSPSVATADGTTINYGAVKNTGGETGHVLSKSELPKHNHIIGNGTDGSSISDPGNHTHGAQTRKVKGDTGNTWALDINAGDQGLQYPTPAGSHVHTGVTGDGTSDGVANQVHENRPPYYVLAYIIKIP